MTQSNDYGLGLSRAWELDRNRACLLIIDMQYATASRAHGLGRVLQDGGRTHEGVERFTRIEDVVVPGIQRLLTCFRELGKPVIHVRVGSERADFSDVAPPLRSLAHQVGNTRGSIEREILHEVSPLEGEIVLDKTTACAFISAPVDDTLKSIGADQLVIAGVSTNTCVDSTARHAADLGYDVVIVEDATGAATSDLHTGALESFGRLFGRVLRVDRVIAELDLQERSAP